MPTTKDINAFLQQNTRNKIVFCKDYIEGIEFINVGTELAMLLGECPEEITSNETMYKQVLNKTQHSDSIGKYLAIENIGILLEPELKLDLRSILSNYSKNQCLIIKTKAKIENDRLYYLDNTDNVIVSLLGLSFIQI